MKGLTRYVGNLMAVLGWSLWLILGALVGVDRQRSLILLKPSRRRRRQNHAPAAGPRLVRRPVDGTQAELRSALVNLGTSTQAADKASREAARSHPGDFTGAFSSAMQMLGYGSGVR